MPIEANHPFDANGMPVTHDEAGNTAFAIPNKDAPKFSTKEISIGTNQATPELYEYLAKHVPKEKLDEAWSGSAGTKPTLLPPEAAASFRAAGISPEPNPALYHPDFRNNAAGVDASTPQGLQQLANMQRATTEATAHMQFEPAVGTSFINRIVEVGAQTSKMSQDELQTWKQKSEQAGIKIAGSKASYVEMLSKAKAFLMNNAGPAKEFAVALADSAVFADPQIVSLLATQAGIVGELQRLKARGK